MSLTDEMVRRIVALERQTQGLLRIPQRRPIVARASTAAGQSIPNTTTTIVDFGTITFDPDSHITTGAVWKFTAKVAGYYRVGAVCLFGSTTTWALGEAADLSLYKNGAAVSILGRDDEMNSAAMGQFKRVAGTDLIALAIEDYIDIRLAQTSGGALTLHPFAAHNYVSIAKVN